MRQELLSPIKPYLQTRYRVYNGTIDLYAYFFELGLNLLKPGGRLGFISSSTFFKTGSGETLRRLLLENTSLETVVDFGDLQIFGGVTTYPAILAMQKTAPTPEQQLNMLVLGQTLPADLNKYFTAHATTMPQASLDIAAWRLENAALTALRHKITAGKPTLKQVYGSPLYGIKTGLNEAFVIDQATRDALIQADPRSAEVLKPFLEGKDLKRWHTESRNIWLIFTRSGIDMTKYPIILDYLEQFRHRLEPKPANLPHGESWSGRASGSYKWYELQSTTAYYAEFEKPKIVWPNLQNVSKFTLDTQHYYINAPAVIVPSADKFLLGLMNSSIMWFFLKNTAISRMQGFLEIKPMYVINIPIPSATDTQKQYIATLAEQCQTIAENRYAKQQAVRQRIPDLAAIGVTVKFSNKLHDWWQLDFPTFRQEVKKCCKQDIPLAERNDWEQWLIQERTAINAMTTQLTTLEQQINTCIYELFDLTAEEITLIESAITT